MSVKYHCHNGDRPTRMTQTAALDGGLVPKIVYVPFRFATECRYEADGYAAKDKLCSGCKHLREKQ